MRPRVLIAAALMAVTPLEVFSEARDTHERLNAVLWVQTSAEFRVLSEQSYRQAWFQIQDKITKAKSGYGIPSAAVEQPGYNVNNLPYAVVMDIDETVLDNSPMSGKLIADRTGYNGDNWTKWVASEIGDFIPGAESFMTKARDAGIAVIFITNRTAKEEAHTIEDLKPLIVPADQILASEEKPSPSDQPWSSEKSPRRAFVAKKYWIIGMVGDDLADFIPDIKSMPADKRIQEANKYQERFGDQWFLLPNPVYGSWDASLYNRSDPDKKQLEDKMKRVRSFKASE